MKLSTVHQVLISTMIAMFVVFTLRSAWEYQRNGDAQQLLLAAVGMVLGLGASFYLRLFRKKLRAKHEEAAS